MTCPSTTVTEVLFGTIDSDNFESQAHPDRTGTEGAQPTTQRVRQTAGSAQPEENSPASSQAGRNIQEIQSLNNLETLINKEQLPMRTPQEPNTVKPGQYLKLKDQQEVLAKMSNQQQPTEASGKTNKLTKSAGHPLERKPKSETSYPTEGQEAARAPGATMEATHRDKRLRGPGNPEKSDRLEQETTEEENDKKPAAKDMNS